MSAQPHVVVDAATDRELRRMALIHRRAALAVLPVQRRGHTRSRVQRSSARDNAQVPHTTRPATVDDAEAVASLVHLAYRSDESRTGWTTEADLVGGQRTDPAMVRELVTTPGTVVLLRLDDDGSLLASCQLERRDDEAYLGMFAVRPGLQGQGLGREMLEAAVAHARSTWGSVHLHITVLNLRPELIAWYERCGFVMTGEEHPFPYGDERYGQPQRDDLVLLGMVRTI